MSADSKKKPDAEAVKDSKPDKKGEAPLATPEKDSKATVALAPKPKIDSKPDPKADHKPDPKADPKADHKPDPKADPKADHKPDPKTESKPDVKPTLTPVAPVPTPIPAATDAAKKPKKETKKEDVEDNVPRMSDAEKQAAIQNAVNSVHDKYGKGSLMLLGSMTAAPVASIPTGCVALDLALGVKGVPRGRVSEIYGPESSGKTTLALHVIANAQRLGGTAAFVDAEHALDANYCSNLGVQVKDLYISQPDSGEQALEIVEQLVTSNAFDIVVVDSVAALVPRAELSGEIGDPHMGLQARLMSQALRRLAGSINKTNTCVIFINQLREKIGVFFGNPETTPGGRALKFYTTVRIEIRKQESIKRGEAFVGAKVKAKVVKNKVAPPFREAEFEVEFGKGILWTKNLAEEALAYGLIIKQGGQYTYGTQTFGSNKDDFFRNMEQQPELCRSIGEIILRDVPLGKLTRAGKKGKGIDEKKDADKAPDKKDEGPETAADDKE